MPSPRAVAGVTQALIPFARLQPREVLLITSLTSFVQRGQEPQGGALPGPRPCPGPEVLAAELLTPSQPEKAPAASRAGSSPQSGELPAASRAHMP